MPYRVGYFVGSLSSHSINRNLLARPHQGLPNVPDGVHAVRDFVERVLTVVPQTVPVTAGETQGRRAA